MTDILTRLRDAMDGSRHLDLICNELAGGVPASTIKETMIGQWLPHYTTSLDAKLSGEDIVMVSEQTTGRWCALQRGAKEAGYAQTEAMARRVACLKARIAKEDAA